MNGLRLLAVFALLAMLPVGVASAAVEVSDAAVSPAAEPFEWHLRLSHAPPAWAVVLAAGFALLWVAAIYAKDISTVSRGRLALLIVLRLAALGLLGLMLVGPVIERSRTGRPRMVLLLDQSESMNTTDRNGLTRFEQAQQTLAGNGRGTPGLIGRLQKSYQVDVVPFADRFAPLAVPSDLSLAEAVRGLCITTNDPNSGELSATRLGDAVDFALRRLPGAKPSAMVLLSDGISTRGEPLSQAARRAGSMGVPIYTVAVGDEHRQPDVAVEPLLAEDLVFPGDSMLVEATVRAIGYAGRQAEVTLRDAVTEEPLAQTSIALPYDGAGQSVRMIIQPTQPGPLKLELRVDTQPDESNTENNVVRHEVQVVDKPIRVLLVQSGPSYEYRAIKGLLERDPAVRLHVRLQEADPEYAEVDPTALPAFPVSDDLLAEYDVVLLGDVDPGLLPRSVWSMLLRTVSEQGTGLVIIAGERFMPSAYRGIRSMEVLLPIESQGANPLRSEGEAAMAFAILPTPFGSRSPQMQMTNSFGKSLKVWKSFPPVTWLLEMEKMKPGVRVLADGSTTPDAGGRRLPVILRHYVGAGEVLMHLTDETWRWRWRTDDRYFARYWGQAVRRLARGRLHRGSPAAGQGGVKLFADRQEYRPREPVRVRAHFADPSQAPADDRLTVQVESNSLPRREWRLERRPGHRGEFVGTLYDLPSGQYELQISPQSTSQKPGQPDRPLARLKFTVASPPQELERLAVDRQALAEAARISQGTTYTTVTAQQLPDDLPPAKPITLERLRPYQLASTHWAIGLLSAIVAAEWLLRRRWGML